MGQLFKGVSDTITSISFAVLRSGIRSEEDKVYVDLRSFALFSDLDEKDSIFFL